MTREDPAALSAGLGPPFCTQRRCSSRRAQQSCLPLATPSTASPTAPGARSPAVSSSFSAFRMVSEKRGHFTGVRGSRSLIGVAPDTLPGSGGRGGHTWVRGAQGARRARAGPGGAVGTRGSGGSRGRRRLTPSSLPSLGISHLCSLRIICAPPSTQVGVKLAPTHLVILHEENFPHMLNLQSSFSEEKTADANTDQHFSIVFSNLRRRSSTKMFESLKSKASPALRERAQPPRDSGPDVFILHVPCFPGEGNALERLRDDLGGGRQPCRTSVSSGDRPRRRGDSVVQVPLEAHGCCGH